MESKIFKAKEEINLAYQKHVEIDKRLTEYNGYFDLGLMIKLHKSYKKVQEAESRYLKLS